MLEVSISSTRLYQIYSGMKNRCYNSKSPAYPRYGGRGITVCEEWLGDNGVQNFIEWSLSHNYNDTLSIDRTDNDKGYSPDNCQWVTRSFNSAKRDVPAIEKNANGTIVPKYDDSLKMLLKGAIIEKGFTIKQVNEELNRRHGTNHSQQNFSNRLKKESFSYVEVEEILDIIGYKVSWVKNV